jgi:putative membrane protein
VIILGLVLVSIAAVFHAYVFVLESLTWTAPRTRAAFGVGSVEEAEATRLLAFNQGFYNLFLAIIAGVGVVAMFAGHRNCGASLIFAGVGSMLAAAVVLLASSPDKARAAITQGILPLIAVVLLVVGLNM